MQTWWTSSTTPDEPRAETVQTPEEQTSDGGEPTVPDEIAGLDVEVQAMYERVRARLGLQAGHREMLGRYEIRAWIANGGMGEVYRAFDSELEREVAIKVVAPRPLSDLNKLRERLRREAKVLAKLEHANVVTVYDAGVENGRVFLVMELITGVTLRERQAREGCSRTERLRLYIGAGRGLLAAHERGVVHRDFKPDNVFVGEDGRPRVGDFGLAYLLGEPETLQERDIGAWHELPGRLTGTGEALGTLGYMAPEQISGSAPDARSDQYAFCVSLWEGVTGLRPFVGAHAKAILEAMAGEPRGGQWLTRSLHRILRTGLALRPEDRHRDMAELLTLLEYELNRPKRILTGATLGAFGVAAIVGLGLGWAGYRVANPDCDLAERVAELPNGENWSALEANTLPGTAERFRQHVETLEVHAREACVSHSPAAEQKIAVLVRSLELTLAHIHAYSHQQVEQFIHEFELTLAARPTQPLTPPVKYYVEETLLPLEARWAMTKVVERSTEALAWMTVSPIDRSELLLRRGRAYALLGDYEFAVTDFRRARRLTTSIDEERHLQAELGLAKTKIMRLEEYGGGKELLESIDDQLRAIGESKLGPRHADFVELSATLARHEGHLDEALALQRAVVARHAVLSRYALVPALVNLANIYDDLGNLDRAESIYRFALGLDSEDPEAAFSLGRLLTKKGERLAEAREWLSLARAAGDHDLQVPAAIELLSSVLDEGAENEIAARRTEAVRSLESDQPRTPLYEFYGWSFVALAHAWQGEFGSEFELAVARSPQPRDEKEGLFRVGFDINVADLARPSHPDVARRFLARALARLECLPDSQERTEILAVAKKLQNEIPNDINHPNL